MKALNCPNCGAALSEKAVKSELVVCEFCGTTFRMSKTDTPEPDMGDLLLGAEFSDDIIPGWEVFNREKLSFHKGSPSELRGKFPPSDIAHYVLKSSGYLDDFDASITIKFLDGEKEMVRAGFYLRFTDQGGYGILISAQGTYTFGYFILNDKGKLQWNKFLGWTYHTALRSGFNETNRLRVIFKGAKFRIYLNGVLATSFKDERYNAGRLHVTIEPGSKQEMGFTLTDLQVREALE